jgi:PIN domain nuclease of toxin-antitoxin system
VARYVLDTHAIVLAFVSPKRLGKRARVVLSRVEQGKDEALLPAVALAEVALLADLGRIWLGLPQIRVALDETPALHFLPLELRQLDIFSTLSALRDPFDRLIVSAARAENARLISRDEELSSTGLVDVVWS